MITPTPNDRRHLLPKTALRRRLRKKSLTSAKRARGTQLPKKNRSFQFPPSSKT
jgi:hypothetical protein